MSYLWDIMEMSGRGWYESLSSSQQSARLFVSWMHHLRHLSFNISLSEDKAKTGCIVKSSLQLEYT
jgi:hypothetical protein